MATGRQYSVGDNRDILRRAILLHEVEAARLLPLLVGVVLAAVHLDAFHALQLLIRPWVVREDGEHERCVQRPLDQHLPGGEFCRTCGTFKIIAGDRCIIQKFSETSFKN